MRQSNADTLLPKELLLEIQQYVQGKTLYIPKLKNNYKRWGENTQSKIFTVSRNEKIRSDFQDGLTIDDLTGRYYLSPETIKKIVYTKD